ncbi:N-acetyl sugar amidotransferase [Aeromonas veronii]|uniref:N-acetyl sugar amidotransferase n=1 Tax=Aeromonas veronii TaxID=654 RepID=UPI00160C1AF3|nr:N-acetyl sugar amidotransferase [Aeromonas veronii]MCS3832207.1 N-acetyl sugar amidotransferase [Aeromonas veronii]
MKFCQKCVMPDTRPGINFDSNGVCYPCLNYEKRQSIDWDSRFKELRELCDKYRGMNGNGPDCMIAVSGGKDSHYQVHLMKEVLGMNPILVSVEDNFPMTNAGCNNIKNISEEFGCEIISMKPNRKLQKKLMRKTFEKYGKPTWYIDRLIYTFPLKMASKLNTPLLVYGENVSFEYGGADAVEHYSAKDIINNGVASNLAFEDLIDSEISIKDLSSCEAPTVDELARIDPIYISYFIPWNSYENYLFAKSRGFKDLTHEWDRTHHIENFDQVDSRAYLVHSWLKYPKFGHASATDYAARYVRYGLLTRDEAIKLVLAKDSKLDPKCVDDFCDFVGYTRSQFWAIIDGFYNRDLFQKNEFGEWKLKENIN